MSGKITVATFSDLPKAEVAKKQLEQAGIPAQLTDESKLQRFWFLSRPLAGKKIKVAIEDFDRGRAVLEKADATDHILRGEIRCPQCGSPSVDYPQFTRKFIITTVAEILCLLHLIDREFYCEHCHYTWPAEIKLPQKTDLLNWPVKS